MAGRMDLEARLRALREGKRLPASPPAPPPPAPVASAASFSWPEVPSNRAAPAVPVAVGRACRPVRRASACSSAAPPVAIMGRSSSDDCTAFPASAEPPRAARPEPEQSEVLRLTAAQLLGPDYEEAVRVAQHAMDSERRQMPHTAIDAYIRAGQSLIEIGRRQAAPHLQDVVRAKALALLQRAEGLSEWTSDVLARDPSQQALAAAYHQSQQERDKSLTEKRELVSRMQQGNREMKEKLNQLALLAKIRVRLKRVVSSRRARKAAEAEAEARERDESVASGDGGLNDVTGEVGDYVEEEEDRQGPNNVTGSGSEEDGDPRSTYQHYRASRVDVTGGSPREAQKIGLLNELHERIGLPQVDHLRKFQPLTIDPTADKKQEELQSELEAAKSEADKLRAAVQEMEQCLRLAAQHSKQRSIKLEKQKAQEFAEVQSELDRVREELEMERRRSASMQSGPASWRSSVASDPGSEELEDTGVMQQLRSSLHKVFHGRNERVADVNGDRSRRASIQRTSYSHDSPRHTPKNQEQKSMTHFDVDEEEKEEGDDGGVWL
ncbi:hypothetical protein PR003_g20280 [Phytophthora rubi]|uniref:MIT domain-containing protein n=1 Tax=Phytophthora rubi TaxID=129364 RepID=A0A6A4DPJ2_9STRA|nr:hypothetical protein PR001_g19182 [Phytophthora rubi]KAE9310380.1 hypothetical protein PR003_g20280 [Phytophthora rubi]